MTTENVVAVRPTERKPRVHSGVVRDLALRILGGAFKPGEILPTEQVLQEEFGISRSALREAMRVLSAKGLVAVRPRVGTAVRDKDAWNRLDADVLEWSLAIAPDLDFVRSLMEARQLFEPAAAEFAARRATAQDVARIEAGYFGMRDSLPHDIAGCCEADVAFHAAVMQASHNAVLRQLVGTIGAALGNLFRLTTTNGASHERTLSAHERVLDCIRLRDAAGAREAMVGLLEVAASDLAPLLAARR
jgi:GntR family transcriptional regulator, galactonate operon transcriptional repressor